MMTNHMDAMKKFKPGCLLSLAAFLIAAFLLFFGERCIGYNPSWYKKAADQGNANALYSLGLMYESGRGVKQSLPDAINYYKQSATKNHQAATSALNRLDIKSL